MKQRKPSPRLLLGGLVMPVSTKKRQKIYEAIAGPVADARVFVRMNVEQPEKERIDNLLYKLTEQIWSKVKIEVGLRD
jgi:hypothetical protein